MANSILDSQYASPNALLTTHGFPVNTSGNALLLSHSPAGVYPNPGGDAIPGPFSFPSQSGVDQDTAYDSTPATVLTGMTIAGTITRISGTGSISINGGAFSSATRSCPANASLVARNQSDTAYSTPSATVWDVGGVQGSFTVTTLAAPGGFSAVLNTGTGVMTITGSGFGTKPTPAPLYFQSFNGIADGVACTHASVGMNYVDYNTSSIPAVITNVFHGGGALIGHGQAGNGNSIQHYVKTISPTKEIFVNQWNKLVLVSGTQSGGMQLKGIRVGKYDAGDEWPYYGGGPKYAGSQWFTSSCVWDTNAYGSSHLTYVDSADGGDKPNFYLYHDPDLSPYTANTSGAAAPYNPPVCTGWNQWFNNEIHHRFNDYGSANGIMRVTLNGKERIRVTHAQPCLNTGEDIDYVNFFPLVDGTTANVDLYTSRIYVDNTPMRVFLGNASTLVNCTGRFMLPPTGWSDTLITVTHGLNIPAGYDWVYVMDASGAEVAHGAYT